MYKAAIYKKDDNGNYTIPIYGEQRTTRLFNAHVYAKLMDGISVSHDTVAKGIALNDWYCYDRDKMANAMDVMSGSGVITVSIKELASSNRKNAVMRKYVVVEDAAGNMDKFKIPHDFTYMSALLFGDFAIPFENNSPSIKEALKRTGVNCACDNIDVCVKGQFR